MANFVVIHGIWESGIFVLIQEYYQGQQILPKSIFDEAVKVLLQQALTKPYHEMDFFGGY
ncbi:hypothetical protein PAECIP111802_05754 [Paenibacillus allorhizosphaerae]|uniref:Uncharacterized protein n=1 Tax=Paenibacillus allorhizosphaerae TaxID=2849866 RepID=A0ABM8VQP6_9BACL|nr:hypothetical protein PAECIP111802_05754 [Paenibacillus allorhizosphaerae]